MRSNRCLLVFAAIAMLVAHRLSVAAEPAQTESLVQANTAFALDLYGQLKSTPGNLFLSPYSISTCLAMTYAGASGDTATQMAQVLHFMGDQQQVQADFARLQEQLKEAEKHKGIQLSIANALWVQQGHPFLPAFLQTARQEYGANVKQADFKTAAPMATREINQWVAQKTKDKIQEILAPGSLNSDTRLVLANAIYFKGAWAEPFEKRLTRSEPFRLSSTRQIDAPFMSHTTPVKYFEDDAMQAVELPYAGGELGMVVLLPRNIDGCSNLEQTLNPDKLKGWLAQMRKQKVEIHLPRFKLESGFSLQGVLAGMGMPDAFSTRADFAGIDGVRDMFISFVFHKAWGEVNEEGTEAAAATAVGVQATAVMRRPPPIPVFRADHPFLFLIRDSRSGSLLFMGRLAEPRI